MKIILTIIICFISLFGLSQEYPKIEIDSKGQKVVIFTFEQAQRIDNDLEILSLLEKSKVQCDSLGLTTFRIIDTQNSKIILLEKSISELKKQSFEKDSLISNKDRQILNLENSSKLQDEQKKLKDQQIDGLKSDIEKEKTKKWIFGTVGLLIGLITTLL
jgi:hypothetical protein